MTLNENTLKKQVEIYLDNVYFCEISAFLFSK